MDAEGRSVDAGRLSAAYQQTGRSGPSDCTAVVQECVTKAYWDAEGRKEDVQLTHSAAYQRQG